MPRKGPYKYVVEDRTDGVLRFYFRRKGQKKIRLPGHPGTDEFKAAYYAALSGETKNKHGGPKMSSKGTLRWLCEQYFQSAEYKKLDKRTQRVRKGIIEHMWAEPIKPGSEKLFEDMPISALSPKAVRTLRDRKAELPEAANGRVKALRSVFSFATKPDVELALTNPARDVGYFKSETEGFHSWRDDEVAKFEAAHPIGTKARLALALMLYTGQRRSDIVLFGRQHVSDGWLKFTQQKNKHRKPVRLELPIHPDLRTIIDASPCGDLAFLVTEFNKPFSANGFGSWFRKRCDEAGLPHCTAHGLRKASATRLANRGATEHEIMSVTGHATSKEVTRYTKAANQKRLAAKAIMFLGADEEADPEA
ncbi:tyrosine-type recombinase/integrase [Rhizobium sp. S95]|uniref:Tyrosine-type recombinase/integrase n=1 Tax=Ciceribacter sichuanensis TaxID=2949647 RepID=A0AAJ1BXC0_9HYPH|nr:MULTISPECIES: tyrosine-type recombinase/integrase [unclassified Ciceribacter]MCM2396217.1 tyrosine-type recombinase/integrase [Ciceribacter sp. S95]MCO5957632.1 tyrosine-type recombinase/integrase [Ciceribacter sp. S101]